MKPPAAVGGALAKLEHGAGEPRSAAARHWRSPGQPEEHSEAPDDWGAAPAKPSSTGEARRR
ncbi:hypothetical protein [Streptomyces sp. NBC_00454]|uniref:hypothetical protein n=1 Tax=Streptomyces sp. NBC_00454 TaxID=2975747 RepID=UPI0030DF8FCF